MKQKYSGNIVTALVIICASAALALHGDTLTLRNGQILQGTFAGGSAGNINFATAQGTAAYPTNEVVSILFSETPAPVVTNATAPTAPLQPAPAMQDVTIPAGTILYVRMQQQITSDNAPGTTFAAALETDLVSTSGVRVAPAGTKVFGTVVKSHHARRLGGRADLELALNQILINNVATPIMTGNFSEAAAREGVKTLGAAGVGAGIGAIADGSDGARTGAAIGLGAAVLKKGDSVVVPPSAILQFQLTSPLTVRIGH